MIITLLFDLDDTLLTNPFEQFQTAYFQALGQALSSRVSPDRMLACLLHATRSMIRNTNPTITLEHAFDADFYPSIGIPKDELHPILIKFYEEVFPSLQPITSPRKDAIECVERAFQRGYRVVVATNPLFPVTAIHQRLAWANLPVIKYPYHLVTTYENFHFSKPSPEYYAEILAKIGWNDEPVVMIGNSYEDDILPAQAIGITTYHIHHSSEIQKPAGVGSHSLENFYPWLDTHLEQRTLPKPETPTAMLAFLKATPAAIDTLLRNMPDSTWMNAFPGKQSNLAALVCHLRDREVEINLAQLKHFSKNKEAVILHGTDRVNPNNIGGQALAEFYHARLEVIQILHSLPLENWNTTTLQAGGGSTSIMEWIETVIAQDRIFLEEIRSII